MRHRSKISLALLVLIALSVLLLASIQYPLSYAPIDSSNSTMIARGDNASIGDELDWPDSDVIQEDGDNDGYSTCDDPILLVKVQCPVGWELEEDEDGISFNNASDFYTYIIIEKHHIFPIDNTADYMRDILSSERENGNIDIINMSETPTRRHIA